ncbi:hypothetical protein KVG88_30260 [Pseudomonas sp. SWRI74]|uniref:Uncharacterized protein n=1 Tax=Pseudomonas azerbaijanoccidentalis TaxID=2842347 RepID=A0ABS6QZK0_9PSED|nr:hypothetical protein [Pseudomonas azerbaijanoccidentalis]MBV4524360.1 hypothetical protein [Pseudomonas azerbaijanoccidentalis]
MLLDEATNEAHEGYINHAMLCRSCHPPTKRYCYEGGGLRDRYEAHYLMSLDLYARRAFLAQLEPIDPVRCESIKTLLIEIHQRNQADLC